MAASKIRWLHMYRKIAFLVLIILVVIQFIQPKRNVSEEGLNKEDISFVYNVPTQVHETLVRKCYDCHSNNTKYPWYSHVQPIGWWLAAHVHEGKEHLNFSEFKTYTAERANHKLEELLEVMEDNSMPLRAYTLLHANTELTPEDEKAIHAWLAGMGVNPH